MNFPILYRARQITCTVPSNHMRAAWAAIESGVEIIQSGQVEDTGKRNEELDEQLAGIAGIFYSAAHFLSKELLDHDVATLVARAIDARVLRQAMNIASAR